MTFALIRQINGIGYNIIYLAILLLLPHLPRHTSFGRPTPPRPTPRSANLCPFVVGSTSLTPIHTSMDPSILPPSMVVKHATASPNPTGMPSRNNVQCFIILLLGSTFLPIPSTSTAVYILYSTMMPMPQLFSRLHPPTAMKGCILDKRSRYLHLHPPPFFLFENNTHQPKGTKIRALESKIICSFLQFSPRADLDSRQLLFARIRKIGIPLPSAATWRRHLKI